MKINLEVLFLIAIVFGTSGKNVEVNHGFDFGVGPFFINRKAHIIFEMFPFKEKDTFAKISQRVPSRGGGHREWAANRAVWYWNREVCAHGLIALGVDRRLLRERVPVPLQKA